MPLLVVAGAVAALAADLEPLRPPKGDKVAVVVFEDLECPLCARMHGVLMEASKKYNVPVIIHDFPLPSNTPPFHAWAHQAAITARFFESKSPELGRAFRAFVFQNQPSIGNNPALFHAVAQRFASEHNVALPFVIDPNGEYSAEIQKDKALGQRVGIEHTPTIYVATNSTSGPPAVEVVDNNKLYEMIEAAQRAMANQPAPRPAAAKAAPAHKKPGT
ncbi:MAG: DsbA family protein [Acidobacteria bacterium]|nr:DsbA family protein [Acidobacteriota bacterium]